MSPAKAGFRVPFVVILALMGKCGEGVSIQERASYYCRKGLTNAHHPLAPSSERRGLRKQAPPW
jgi:hypothetical protein